MQVHSQARRHGAPHALRLMENGALERCLSYIEQRLGWGDAGGWTTEEFEDLSLRIQEETGRTLSATTLKRVWGRVAYHSSPSRYTLDTLARFIGHASWRTFENTADCAPSRRPPSPDDAGDPVLPAPATTAPATRRISGRLRFVVVPLLLLGLGSAVWTSLERDLAPHDSAGDERGNAPRASSGQTYETVAFRSRPLVQGVPNTVIFDYDVRGIEADSFFIQQSWDQQRRAQVDPKGLTFTSVYYRPGFFNAKLLADDRVIAEHPVHVTTDGWVALIDGEPTPVYLTGALRSSDGALSVAPEWLQTHGYDASAAYQVVEYDNVRTFGALQTDAFSFETALRRTVDDGRYPCGHAEVSVLGERGAFKISLGRRGCVGNMGLLLGMRYLAGATNDLSPFGVDLSAWQRLRLDVSDGQVRIRAGANAPFTAPLDEAFGRVVGLRFRFEGAGAIDYVTLRDTDGAVVYEEVF